MLYKNREKFDSLSQAIGRKAAKLPLSANQWTLLSLILIAITAYFVINKNFIAAAFFFLITAFIDLIDGAVARHKKSANERGAYIDTITDRYVEFVLLLSLAFIDMPKIIFYPEIWIIVGLFGSMMTTYAKSASKEKELVLKELRGGLLERSERLALLFVAIVLGYFSLYYTVYIIILYGALTNITALQRIFYALQNKKKRPATLFTKNRGL